MTDPAAVIDDNELMRRVQTGDFDAFAALFFRFRGKLQGVAESRLGDRSLAEDVVQETFLWVFKSRHTFRLEASFRAWLWSILFHQCHRLHHRRQRSPSAAGSESRLAGMSEEARLLSLLESPDPQPMELALARERREQLDRVLLQLPAAQADALRLRFFGELKFREIADTMECSLPTAKNRVRAGLLKMSEILAAAESLADSELALKALASKELS